MVAPFGNALHVSGTDRAALERAVSEVARRPGLVHHLANGAVCEELAVGDVGERVAALGLVHVVRAHEHRDALVREVVDVIPEVAPFGNVLHVSGTDRAALEATLASIEGREGLALREVAPSLEDVFIHLMRNLGSAAKREPSPQPSPNGEGANDV